MILEAINVGDGDCTNVPTLVSSLLPIPLTVPNKPSIYLDNPHAPTYVHSIYMYVSTHRTIVKGI